MNLISKQTGPEGKEVRILLIEEGLKISSELYLAIIILVLGTAELRAQSVFVREKTGQQNAFFFGDIRKISFSPGEIILSITNGGSQSYALDDLKHLNYMFLTSLAPKQVFWKTGDGFTVFPNPASDHIYLQLSSGFDNTGRLEILSLEGKLMHAQVIDTNSNVYQINVSGLPEGFYVCRLSNGSAIETTKFIKQ